MLNGTMGAAWRKGYRDLIEQTGTDMTFQAAAGDPVRIRMSYKTISREDTDLVNAYGMDARLFTAMADDFPEPPILFDRIQIDGDTQWHTINSVHEVRLGNDLLAHRMVSRKDR